MKDAKWAQPEELSGAGSRRIIEALMLVTEEMRDFDDDLPEMPAGILMKSRPEGGGRAAL